MSDIHAQSIPVKIPKKSGFDRGHRFAASTNVGIITPVFARIFVPGVSFSNWSEFNIKFSPLNVPIMQRVECRVDWFAVPLRLLHQQFEDFITGGKKGDFEGVPPYTCGSDEVDSKLFVKNGLFDYLRVQPHVEGADPTTNTPINLYKFLAYQKIYADYYADEVLDADVIDSINDALPFSGGIHTPSSTVSFLYANRGLKTICYKKDYFTSAQPEPQRGDAVYLMSPLQVQSLTGNTGLGMEYLTLNHGSDTDQTLYNVTAGESEENLVRIPLTMHQIEEFRAVQNWQDNNALFGGRYPEQLLGRYGVRPDDARLQRAEFIGGAKFVLQVTEVTQTSATQEESGDYLGGFAGKMQGLANTSPVKYFTREHCVIMGLLSIRPEATYAFGTQRDNLYMSRFDFITPEFDNIGEQAIKNAELFTSGNKDIDEAEFGYQPIYDDERAETNYVAGDFRDTLNFWHTAQMFVSAPPLNSEFVHVDHTDFDRIFADVDENDMHVFFECYHHQGVLLPLRKFPVKTSI